jgi:hypothetical protein
MEYEKESDYEITVAPEDPNELRPWAEPVNAAALLDRLTQCFRSYLSLEPGSSEVLSLWTVPLTLLMPASLPADLPQIARAPLRESYVTLDPRSGHAPPRPSSNITPATVFRVVDAFHPTLLIGEADPFLDNRRELTGILNTGHSRNTAFVERTETVQGVKYARRFSTFAAIGIAAIGNLPQDHRGSGYPSSRPCPYGDPMGHSQFRRTSRVRRDDARRDE